MILYNTTSEPYYYPCYEYIYEEQEEPIASMQAALKAAGGLTEIWNEYLLNNDE